MSGAFELVFLIGESGHFLLGESGHFLLGESGHFVVSGVAADRDLLTDGALDPFPVTLTELDVASVVLFDFPLDVDDERGTLVVV